MKKHHLKVKTRTNDTVFVHVGMKIQVFYESFMMKIGGGGGRVKGDAKKMIVCFPFPVLDISGVMNKL